MRALSAGWLLIITTKQASSVDFFAASAMSGWVTSKMTPKC